MVRQDEGTLKQFVAKVRKVWIQAKTFLAKRSRTSSLCTLKI